MKNKLLIAAGLAVSGMMMSCQDDLSSIGNSITTGEVAIMADTITTSLEARSIYLENFDGRNITKLLGRINVPEYGTLNCSFVSQMMCATSMNIPDSITVDDVDSLRLVLSVPKGSLTGDSLAPQQLKVYALERQLPPGLTSSFNPEGYYDASNPLGVKSYTVSNIAKGDSAMKRESFVRIPVTLPLSLGRKIFTQYREDPSVFQWPSTFNAYFPGIYVEQNFGNGCIANITKAEIFTYWRTTKTKSEMQADSTYVDVKYTARDSICLMAYQPEVIASNVIDFKISDYITGLVNAGKKVVTTPGGYIVNMTFPIKSLIETFKGNGSSLSVVSSLKFEIPAETIENDYGIGVAPNMLMIKKSEYEAFFAENKVPDGITSFYAAYDSDSGTYKFNAMRSYFIKMLEAYENGEPLDGEESEFVLVPVSVQTETKTNYDGSVTTYVSRCQWYIEKPTMTVLDTDNAVIMFTYSSQLID